MNASIHVRQATTCMKKFLFDKHFLFSAIGMFLFTLPHYIAGRYLPPSTVDTSIKMCSLNSTKNNDCPEGSAVDWYYMAIFCISQFIAGAGILPMHSMVPAYFEENLNKKLSPIYIAFWDMSIYVGPLVGFGLSDSLTSLYVDITLVSHNNFIFVISFSTSTESKKGEKYKQFLSRHALVRYI